MKWQTIIIHRVGQRTIYRPRAFGLSLHGFQIHTAREKFFLAYSCFPFHMILGERINYDIHSGYLGCTTVYTACPNIGDPQPPVDWHPWLSVVLYTDKAAILFVFDGDLSCSCQQSVHVRLWAVLPRRQTLQTVVYTTRTQQRYVTPCLQRAKTFHHHRVRYAYVTTS